MSKAQDIVNALIEGDEDFSAFTDPIAGDYIGAFMEPVPTRGQGVYRWEHVLDIGFVVRVIVTIYPTSYDATPMLIQTEFYRNGRRVNDFDDLQKFGLDRQYNIDMSELYRRLYKALEHLKMLKYPDPNKHFKEIDDDVWAIINLHMKTPSR